MHHSGHKWRWRSALAYVLFGAAWFQILHWALEAEGLHTVRSDNLVGWAFVGGSTVLVFLMLAQEQRIRRRAERIAARRGETLAAIFQASPAGILVLDEQSLISSCSPAAERMLGLPERQLIGRPLPLYPEQEFSVVAERTGAGELPAGFETTHTRSDGTSLPLQVQVVSLRPDGEPSRRLLVVLADISRQKQSASATQALQRRMLAINQVGRCLADAEHSVADRLTKATRLMTTLLADWCVLDITAVDGSMHRLAVAHADKTKSAIADQLMKVDLQDAKRKERMTELLNQREGYLRQLLGAPGDYLVPSGDPQLEALSLLGIHCTSAITVPIRVHQRTLGLITVVAAESGRTYTPDDLALVQEVAARMGALLDAERLYADSLRAEAAIAAIFDSMVEGVMGFDEAGRLTSINRAAETLIGRSRTELLGECLHDLIQCEQSGGQCAKGDCPVMHVLRTGDELLDRPLIFLRRDGALMPAQCAVTPIRKPDGMGGAVLTLSPVALGGAVKAWRLVGNAS